MIWRLHRRSSRRSSARRGGRPCPIARKPPRPAAPRPARRLRLKRGGQRPGGRSRVLPVALLPPGRGPGGMTRRPPARRCWTPHPTSPLKGGGEKTARPASPFGHRERSRTGPPDSSPLPGRRSEGGLSSAIALGEVGRGGCPGLRRPDGGLPTASAPPPPRPLFSPLEGGRGDDPRRPPAHRRRTPLPTSPLKGGGEKSKGGGEGRGRRRFASRSGVGDERASSRLRSSPLKGGGEKSKGEEGRRRRFASWAGVGTVRASSRLRSSPLEGGRREDKGGRREGGGGPPPGPASGANARPPGCAPPP